MTPARRGPTASLLVAACALVLSACGAHAAPAHDALLVQRPLAAVTVRLHTVAGLGSVLTDGAGHVLYMFPPDAGSRVSCTGACAGTWPPLAVARGVHPTAGRGLIAADLSTLPDPNTGGRVVTYAGYPLYRYAGDVEPGTAHGQGLFSDGGPWYVLDARGEPITDGTAR